MIVDNTKKCDCEICVRHRELKMMLARISDPIARGWFEDFYSSFCEVEETLSCYKLYNDNLKRMYPKIWNEVTTLKYLDRDEAQFPEKQL